MERSDASSVSTDSESMMELPFYVQIGGISEISVEIELARIALSCHLALDLLCDKAGTHDSAQRLTWAPLPLMGVY